MAFRLKPDEFFRGTIHKPESTRELTVVQRGTRYATVKMTVREAALRNWDWVIELCRDTGNEDQPIETIKHWSSLAGELPPVDRPAGM